MTDAIAFLLITEPSGSAIVQPLAHHALFLLLTELVLLLLMARGMGELMRYFQLPPVIGELLAGVFLGPSVFGLIAPQLQGSIFPKLQGQSDLLAAISWLGVLFLLMVTGLETDLNLILRKGKNALIISVGGILVPFITGFGLGWLLPNAFVANPSQRLVFSLFIATAMSISAVPVIAKVLMDMNLMRRDIAQMTLAAGMTDDTIGWILLSVVSGLASSGTISISAIVRSMGGAILFLTLAFTLGRTVVDQILRWVDEHVGGLNANLSIVIALGLAFAALTHALGIEAALGAFVVGILIGESRRFNHKTGEILEVMTAGFLAPIFFAAAGLKVNLLQLASPMLLFFGFVVLAVACIGKFAGAYLGSRLGGLSHWEGIAIGSGMNARGAMEIIVATIGLSLGVLNQAMYSIVVMVAIVTSLMAPPLLRWSLAHVVMGEDEQRRLTQEESTKQSFVKQVHRILIPTSGGPNVQMAAQLIQALSASQTVEITALYATSDSKLKNASRLDVASGAASGAASMEESPTVKALQVITETLKLAKPGRIETKVKYHKAVLETILQEASRGYDLLVLGATERTLIRGVLFNSLVDRVIQHSPCATLVVKSCQPLPMGEICVLPGQKLHHILVPTVGSLSSRNAVELASAIASSTQAQVTLLHVINQPQVEYVLYEQPSMQIAVEIATELLNFQLSIAKELGAKANSVILEGYSPEIEILKFAQEHGVDLIFIGSHPRLMSGRAFYGHRVDAILSKATCPVALLSVPWT